MSRNTTIHIISLVVLIAISCSFLTIPINSKKSVSQLISASQGGELTLPDKTVLKIPAGSLQYDTQVTLSKVSDGNIPAAGEMAGVGGTYDIDLGTASLQKPATLEIPFDQMLLPDGSEPSQVFLTYYDETSKEWVYAGGVVDTVRNVVVLEISHASWWRPATWNWSAWIAVLDKLLSVSVVDFVEAVQLLTNDCPQSGNYLQVDSSQALNLIQGCVEVDDSQQPQLRIVNPKSFFYEIKPISGGNDYPAPTLLAPGDEVKFEASTSDPSPLIIQAEMTQKSGWYLVIHMIITMLPGANQFGIQPSSVACITERLADVSDLASAVESLLVSHDGAAAAESISNFMLDGDAVRRFLTAADDCNFGPSPTWSVEGIKQIGGAVSTIMSATDYIANYFAGNNYAQISFSWIPFPDAEIAYMGTDGFGNQLDIRLVSSDGSHIITIPLDDSTPDEYIPAYVDIKFSPNGQFIAFGRSKYTNYEVDGPTGKVSIKAPTGSIELVVVDLSTNKVKIVINSFEGSFDWSPDSRNILYIDNGGLWMTDIYTGEENEFMPPLQDNPIMNIKWSPNGSYIAFHEHINMEGYGPFGIMKSDGSNIVSWKRQVGEFDWSPDGSKIVFDEVLYSLQKGLRLYIANPDGSNQRILFEDQDLAVTHPRWSPDGRSIAFLISPADFPLGSPHSLWIIETSGNNLHQLTSKDLESVSGMSWSPDSNKLVVSAINGFQMYVISLDGENFYLGQGRSPVWRP